MKKRLIRKNKNASAWPVVILFIILAIVSMVVLIFGSVLEPFFNLMEGEDDTIDPDYSAPRGLVSQFLQIIWPKGLLLAVLIGSIVTMLMYYQKKRYKEVQ